MSNRRKKNPPTPCGIRVSAVTHLLLIIYLLDEAKPLEPIHSKGFECYSSCYSSFWELSNRSAGQNYQNSYTARVSAVTHLLLIFLVQKKKLIFCISSLKSSTTDIDDCVYIAKYPRCGGYRGELGMYCENRGLGII